MYETLGLNFVNMYKVCLTISINRCGYIAVVRSYIYTVTNLIYFHGTVRVAERSKAPDSRSGPHLWAWVQIPFLASFFFVSPFLHILPCTYVNTYCTLNHYQYVCTISGFIGNEQMQIFEISQ